MKSLNYMKLLRKMNEIKQNCKCIFGDRSVYRPICEPEKIDH